MEQKISKLLEIIRNKNPLVHHITNYVSANDCANITLAIGASPVMTDDINEVYDVVSKADSLVLNLGTLSDSKVDAMLKAGKRANELKIPVILDPVGAGSSEFRTQRTLRIIKEVKLAAIRGNLSELKTLCGVEACIKGVDSAEIHNGKDGYLAVDLAKKLNLTVAVTGPEDIVTDGYQLYKIKNGNMLMSKVTGMGCMCTSIIGSCLGTGADTLTAVLAGVAFMGIAGERAYEMLDKEKEGTGFFRIRLIDSIYNMTPEIILKKCKIFNY